jgi:hypothetical protein
MFKTVESRFALRCTLVGTGALLSSLAASTYGSDLELGEVILALSSGFGAGLGYAGLGGALKSVEPNIGRK